MAVFKKRASAEQFTSHAKKVLEGMHGVERVEVAGELSLGVVLAGQSTPQVVNLHNVFQDFGTASRGVQRHQLTMVLASITDGADRPATFEEARAHLLPALRNPSYPGANGLGPIDERPIARPYLPFVLELVVLDRESSMCPLQQTDAAQWGVDPAEVFAVARANLARRPVTGEPSREVPGAIRIVGPNAYDAALLTSPRDVRSTAARVGLAMRPDEAVLALIPTRDDLLVLPSADDDLVTAALAWAAHRFRESSRRVSPVPYRLTEQDVEPWLPSPSRPCHPHVVDAGRLLADAEYHYQKLALDEVIERSGEDLFVASYMLTGTGQSVATWGQDVDTLLPEAEHIFFVADDRPASVLVLWDDARRITGPLMSAEPDMNPPRWRVHGWPPPPVLDELRVVAREI